ncbi:hypothetical protein CIW52_18665 [Mycolicibacterium sp. P9-64]|uniref:hypothetical protein n=1 Tax=Mycolicibacterium sp. P9-64 TaxID=2024612 RepID=UPI0011EC953F|nr:hypothetical protein [Mycolicibacterium sp. P9-64]KAA0081754.1 hypothetical protein CIW52_18665 [Mycolicibacterium sp. P9-64]
MEIYEMLTLAVIVVLAAATTAAIYYGLLGMVGSFYVVRCASCGHLASSAVDQPQPSCWRCRHPALRHPMHAINQRRGHAG